MNGPAKYRVVIRLCPHQQFYHAAKFLAGLELLAAQGVVQLTATKSEIVDDGLTLRLQVESLEERASRAIALDLRDQSDLFSRDALESADVYYKRSYWPGDADAAPKALREKLRPFGLNFGCSANASKKRWLGAILARCLIGSASDRSEAFYEARQFWSLPDYRAFEQPASAPVESTILFQTRVWPPQETTEDLEEVNGARVSLVRALRREFGKQFVGGLVPTEYACRRYPDLITDQPYSRGGYAALTRRSLIGVYSRGLHHSTAFKLAEYMAAGLCIVAEPPRSTLPAPVEPGCHYRGFQSPEECIQQCRLLLADSEAATAMRQSNAGYYRDHVAPEAHVLELLEGVFHPAPVQQATLR